MSDFTFTFRALEKEMATHLCSCLENPRDGGAWWAAVYGVTQSRTRLKRLSSSSISYYTLIFCLDSIVYFSHYNVNVKKSKKGGILIGLFVPVSCASS